MSADNGNIVAETFAPLEAKKFDAGKLRWALLPWDAVGEVVKVLMYGAKKYGPWNWCSHGGMDWTRLSDASIRHVIAWQQGQDNDEDESGLPHLAHAACGLLFLLAYSLRGIGKDDRHVG